MNKIKYVINDYEDKMYVNGEYLGRVDTLSAEEIITLLGFKGIFELEKIEE